MNSKPLDGPGGGWEPPGGYVDRWELEAKRRASTPAALAIRSGQAVPPGLILLVSDTLARARATGRRDGSVGLRGRSRPFGWIGHKKDGTARPDGRLLTFDLRQLLKPRSGAFVGVVGCTCSTEGLLLIAYGLPLLPLSLGESVEPLRSCLLPWAKCCGGQGSPRVHAAHWRGASISRHEKDKKERGRVLLGKHSREMGLVLQ
jgi:hypothetical protein